MPISVVEPAGYAGAQLAVEPPVFETAPRAHHHGPGDDRHRAHPQRARRPLARSVSGLVEAAQETRERLAHLEGHVCSERDEPDRDEDEADDVASDDQEVPHTARSPEPAPEPLNVKAN